jgi:hypothetical protein
LQALVGIYGKEEFGNVFKKLNITDDAEKRKLIRNAVSYSVRTTKLYSDYPKPKDQEQWSTAWNNAKSVWEGQNSRHKDDEVTIERKDEPIPALLVKRQWKPGLREYFEMLFGQKKQGEAPTCSKKGFLKRSEHAAISLGAFLSLAGFLAVYLASYYVFSDKAKVITGISWWFGLLIILWVAQTTLYLAIRKRIMDLAGYETALSSFWLGITLTFWGAAIAQVLSNL